MKRLILFLVTAVLMVSCEFLDPRPIEDLTTDELLSHAAYGEGLLINAYANMDAGYIDYSDYYTDNAVPSVPGGNRLALGTWTVQSNPIGRWDAWYETIGYLNMYLRDCKDLLYSVSAPALNKTLQKQRRGEAFFLRAWYEWQLLQHYAGYPSGSSTCMGVPIVTEVLTTDDDLDLPRNTYEECVLQIATDCDSAIALLPDFYYGDEVTNSLSNRSRADGMTARALKSRAYLYAASPAYGPSTQDLWIRAAEAANEARDSWGYWLWLQPYDAYVNVGDDFDNIFFTPEYSSNDWEYAYYPPSLYGAGSCNPSQNLVDAFPCLDGYPIDESPLFNPDDPYTNRDPRLAQFIFHNGMVYNETAIETYVGGNDAPGGLSLQGTRTGYYLKKNLSSDVRLTPGDVTTSYRFKVLLSMTEIYLNFAEAANEAYGPTDATFGYSALRYMAMLRYRAGIGADPWNDDQTTADPYLQEQANLGREAFRDLIQNERRIELCFEGHRFWDMRRWNLPLSHTVTGVRITVSSDPVVLDNTNIALNSVPSTDYCSSWETLEAINDGFEPASSADHDNGIYGNWYSGGTWRYIQYDFPDYPTLTGSSNIYTLDQSDVYWFSDGGGLLMPEDTYIEYWNTSTEQWIEIPNPVGYGVNADTWNVTTFDPVSTDKIRMSMYGTESCGVIEWKVWGYPTNTPSFDYEYRDIETHSYQDYMRYVPVPYNQTLVMSNLKQNSGW